MARLTVLRPNVEVAVYPRATVDMIELRILPVEQHRRRDAFQLCIFRKLPEERIQKALSAIGVALPRMLTIEDHTDDGLLVRRCRGKRADVADQVPRRFLRIPRGIDEADVVGETRVAKEQQQRAAIALPFPR